VTLIIALIMLVIIGLTSASIMRSSLNTDLVANNSRVQALATQAAQIALRYCEREVVKDTTKMAIGILAAKTPGNWESFSNWYGTGSVAVTVPATAMKSDNSSFSPTTLPQCLAEYDTSLAGVKVIVVTARGFSPDYSESEGRTTAGSVVWVQSRLRIQ